MDLTSRRRFLTGLTGFVACAPAIVRASSLMAVKATGQAFRYESIEVSLGYAITREQIRDLLMPGLASIKMAYDGEAFASLWDNATVDISHPTLPP